MPAGRLSGEKSMLPIGSISTSSAPRPARGPLQSGTLPHHPPMSTLPTRGFARIANEIVDGSRQSTIASAPDDPVAGACLQEGMGRMRLNTPSHSPTFCRRSVGATSGCRSGQWLVAFGVDRPSRAACSVHNMRTLLLGISREGLGSTANGN